VRGEITTQQRAGDAGEAEDGAKDSLIASAVARWHDVSHHRLGRDDEPAAAQTLDGAKHNQLRHVLAQSAQRRTDEKEHDRRLHHDLSPVQVAELSVHRRDDGLRQQISGHDPRQVLESAQIAHDRRERGRYNCGV